ncbi:type II toxin-antitoxin system VapC family toxin [Candidatus Woesearchaeota archaeon]|nr:type II toxin-antitoxin system VapC family toxin [Candidatus Woesearchaeota archaeon]
MVVYLDANIFIFPVLHKDQRSGKALAILKDMNLGKFRGITSALTIDEVSWALIKETRDRAFAIQECLEIFKFDNLEIVAVDKHILFDAMQLMKKYQALKPRDAIHIITALRNNTNLFITDDADFDSIKEIKRKPL